MMAKISSSSNNVDNILCSGGNRSLSILNQLQVANNILKVMTWHLKTITSNEEDNSRSGSSITHHGPNTKAMAIIANQNQHLLRSKSTAEIFNHYMKDKNKRLRMRCCKKSFSGNVNGRIWLGILRLLGIRVLKEIVIKVGIKLLNNIINENILYNIG